MDDKYIKQFYNEVCRKLDGEYKIILEPKRTLVEDWIEYDQVKWEIEEPVQGFLNKLIKEKHKSIEEKILDVYNFICMNYIYDANVV